MRLYLVRHGETEFNKKGLALGQADVDLNDTGRWQAARLAEAFGDERLDAVYSSPLSRARETAEAIATRHDLTVGAVPDLIEMNIGEVEGLTFAQVRERFPALAQNWARPDGPTFRMPGGEALVDVQQRALSVLESLRGSDGGRAVVAVSHNFVILSLLASVLGIELAHFRALRQALAAVSTLEISAKRTTILRLNDTCHLEVS